MPDEPRDVPSSAPLGGAFAPAPLASNAIDPHALAMSNAAVAEIQAGYIVAMKNPRNEDQALQRVLQACKRYEFAKDALYGFQKGKWVEGPSIDLMRELVRGWHNIRHELEVVSMTKDEIVIRAKVTDLESNASAVVGDRIARKIQRKVDGETKWITAEDERDLRELTFRRGSIALRRALEEIIPSWLVEQAVAAVKVTCAAKVSSGRDEVVRALVRDFDKLGIPVAMVEKKFGVFATMPPDSLQELRAICSAIRDGYTRASEVFEVEEKTDDAAAPSTLRTAAAEARERVAKGKKSTDPKPEAKTETKKPDDVAPSEPKREPVVDDAQREAERKDEERFEKKPDVVKEREPEPVAKDATEPAGDVVDEKKPETKEPDPPDVFTVDANILAFDASLDAVVLRLKDLVLPAKKTSAAGILIAWYLEDQHVPKVSLLSEPEKRKLLNELQEFVESKGRDAFFKANASA